MLERIYGQFERFALGDKTWADRVPLERRWHFFQHFGIPLGQYGELTITNFVTSDILAEINDGKMGCARLKWRSTQEVGLNINLPEAILRRLK